jgi:hypothetical protein
MNQVKKKLFSLSLKGRATEWYKTLKDGRSIDTTIGPPPTATHGSVSKHQYRRC